MKINEIIFQGAMGQRIPIKISLARGVHRHIFPSILSPDDICTLLTALLYPSQLRHEERERIESGGDIKIAVSFQDEHNTYRILRRESDETLRLQIREGSAFRDVMAGPKIEQLLAEQLRFPDYALFRMLNLWRFGSPIPSDEVGFRMDALDERTRDIVLKYRLSLEAESLEDQLKSVDGRIDEAKKKLGEAVRIEEKLEKARAKYKVIAIAELSEDDLVLLRDRDERLEEYDFQLRRLMSEEEDANAQVDRTMPSRPWKDPIFWAGLTIVVMATVASIALMETHRFVALANVLGLGAATFVLLRYFNDLERAGVHFVRLDSIKRRLLQVREEQAAFKERLNHLLIHAGVEEEEELIERDQKSQQLKSIIDRLDAQLAKERAKPSYQITREQLTDLHNLEDDVRARRDELPPNLMTSYQLERDLRELGVDPELAANPPEENREAPAYDKDAFTRLFEVARRGGMVIGGALDDRVRKMWSKITGHILGERFRDVDLVDQGRLSLGALTPEQVDMWSRTRATEVQLVASSLALALQINLPKRFGELTTIVIEDPVQTFSGDQAERLTEVFASAARKSQILLCKFE